MTSISSRDIAAITKQTHKNVRQRIAYLVKSHGYPIDLATIDAECISEQNHQGLKTKEYILPMNLYSWLCEHMQLLSKKLEEGKAPYPVTVTTEKAISTLVVSYLTKNPGETLSLSRIAHQYSTDEDTVLCALQPYVVSKKLKKDGAKYFAS